MMKTPVNILRTTGAVALLLLGAGAQFAAAQASVPQQLNDVRKQVNQPAPQTQTKTPAPAAQPATKQPTTPAAVAKTPTQAASPAQGKNPVAGSTAAPAVARAQTGKPGTAAAASAQVKPVNAPQAKVIVVKPTNELKPKVAMPGPPVAPGAKTAQAIKTVSAPGAQPKATPAVAEVPVPPIAQHVARRDPFDPLVDKTMETAVPQQVALPAGKPGLVVASLRVDGIVKGTSGMIAIVSNPQQRVYFLREGDHLYDGDVEHITMEGVSFHQTGKDAFGKPMAREMTKRLYPTPGEQQ